MLLVSRNKPAVRVRMGIHIVLSQEVPEVLCLLLDSDIQQGQFELLRVSWIYLEVQIGRFVNVADAEERIQFSEVD